MYVTKPLSWYRKFPAELSSPPSEDGPNSGILVILDEEAEPTCCFGLCKSNQLDELPFPQNKKIVIRYSTGSGQNKTTSRDPVFFIPVLGQPLSSNRNYVLKPRGSHKGEAFTSSKEEDAVTCCFCKCFSDVKPQPSDHYDEYQQFEICPRSWGGFVAKSVEPDGVPPQFLRRKGWRAHISTPRNFTIGEAPGLNAALLAYLNSTSHYLARLLNLSLSENGYNEDNAVVVDVKVEREVFRVGRNLGVALHNERIVVDGVMWFRSSSNPGGEADIGLSLAIVERMKWEQERFGWTSNEERQERIKRVETFGSGGLWNKIGCYMLVESFVLRRMDGSLALTYDFKHTHQIRSKWE